MIGLYILYAVLACLAALIIYMVIKTALCKPKKFVSDYKPPEIDKDEIVGILQNAIRIPTVTKFNEGDDQSSFLVYHEYLKKTFPEIFKRAEVTIINKYSLIIKIKGTDESLLPGCMLAHQDVVPVVREDWSVEPFEGEIRDGYIYGRGSQDMKSQTMTELYGLELLLREGKEPKRTIYFCFGHDEEATGKEGAKYIVKYLEENKIRFEFLIDEGGTIIDGTLLGVKRKVALIGICEKGYVDYMLTAEKDGGHASAPKKESSVDAIADAIHDLRRSPRKAHWTAPLKETFSTLAPYMPPVLKFLCVNRAVFGGLLKKILCTVNPMANSALRTTFAFTELHGSTAPNVIPAKATAIVNTRIITGENQKEIVKYMQKVVGKSIHIDVYGEGFDPAPVSSTKGSFAYENLVKSAYEIFDGYAVAPYPFIATTDSKRYYGLCSNIYRFTPFEMTLGDQKRLHGVDERCNIEFLVKAAQYFRRFYENTCY